MAAKMRQGRDLEGDEQFLPSIYDHPYNCTSSALVRLTLSRHVGYYSTLLPSRPSGGGAGVGEAVDDFRPMWPFFVRTPIKADAQGSCAVPSSQEGQIDGRRGSRRDCCKQCAGMKKHGKIVNKLLGKGRAPRRNYLHHRRNRLGDSALPRPPSCRAP